MGPRRIPPHFVAGFRAVMPLWLGVVPFGLVYAVLARDAGLSLVETQSLSVLVFAGSAQVSAVGLFGTGAAAARDRLDDVPAERAARALRAVARPAHPAPRLAPPGRRLLPHGRGVRGRRRAGGAHVRVPAGRGAEPLRHVERRDARGGARRHGDHRPGRARHRSRVPARLPRAPRAARPDACRARGRRRVGSAGLRPLASACPAACRSCSPASPEACSGASLTRGRPDDDIRLDDAAREVA